MNWFDRILPPKIKTVGRIGKKGVPHGLWNKCSACQSVLYAVELERSLHVCPKCDHHMRVNARQRLESFFDTGSIKWIAENITPIDVLRFKDQKKYKDRLLDAKRLSGASEAMLVATGQVGQLPVTATAFEFKYMGGSMGSVVGERFVRAVNHSIEFCQPLVCFSASGGARMQEALFSLMQMSKTAAAISRLKAQRIPYISVLTDPTMGGVSASLAMLGDIIIAEPNALVGFAGPRVIEQTVRETLPEGFQKAEFLLEHGAIDMIVNRRNMKSEISSLLRKLGFDSGQDSATEVKNDSESLTERSTSLEGELSPSSNS